MANGYPMRQSGAAGQTGSPFHRPNLPRHGTPLPSVQSAPPPPPIPPQASDQPPHLPPNHLLSALTDRLGRLDGETLLLLGILFLLYREKADPKLLLALAYILL